MKCCQNCGNQILDTDKYCNKCGIKQINIKVLCRLSLILFILAVFLPCATGLIVDAYFHFEIIFCLSAFLWILAVILIGIVRICVPDNNFAKVILWLYLIVMFSVIMFYFTLVAICNFVCDRCKID